MHRADCKNRYLKPDWQPAWVRGRRSPAFFSFDDATVQTPFGVYGNYVWGNVPAIDCLQIPENESESATTSDFKVCFAGNGSSRCMPYELNTPLSFR